MQKYTIIYSETFQVGSHSNSIVSKKEIEIDEPLIVSNVEETLSHHGIDINQVNYIFEGHFNSAF